MTVSLRPSDLRDGAYIIAQCRTCRNHRYLGSQFLLEHGGDVPICDMQHRIRCVARPHDKRGPACGGAMDLDVGARIEPNRPSNWKP